MKRFIVAHTRLHRGLMNVFAALLVFLICAWTICDAWRSVVDGAFGIQSGAISLSDDPEDYPYPARYGSALESISAERALVEEIQEEGSVLLKGTASSLQVGGNLGVTLFGMRSYMSQFGGTIGSTISRAETVRLGDALEEKGFLVNPDMQQFYKDRVREYNPSRAASGNCIDVEEGAVIHEVPRSEYTEEATGDFTGYKDAAVIVFGRDAGESCSYYPGKSGIADPEEFTRSSTGNILGLSDDEKDLVSYVKEQGFEKVIVLINSTCTMEIEELKRDNGIDSILWIGTPGAFGFLGVADLLKGEAVPSGHLADTFAVNTAKSAAVQNYGVYTFANRADIDPSWDSAKSLRANWYVVETEGIYIGYKYYETRYFDSIMEQGNAAKAAHGETSDGGGVWNYDQEVSYAFGYGVEGSTFKEEVLSCDIDWSGETDSRVVVKVTNTGNKAAKHVVQLYVSVPYTEYDRVNGIEKSAIQLAGYGKTGDTDRSYLEPGASEEVVITFNTYHIASYDKNYEHDGTKGAYRLEAGTYCFVTGNGAHEAVQTVIMAQDPEKLSAEVSGIIVEFCELLEEVNFTVSQNGGLIENHFADADINNLNCGTEVVYLSRNDWAGTFPTEVTDIRATKEMIYELRNETLDLAAWNAETGEADAVFGSSNGARGYMLKGMDYDDPVYEKVMDATELSVVLGTVTGDWKLSRNSVTPRMTPSDSPLGFIVSYGNINNDGLYALNEGDEGYGYEPNVFPSGVVVASAFSHEIAARQGEQVAEDGIWSGINWWFGPGLNIHRTPYNGRNVEYYSEDSVLGGTTARDVIEAAQKNGLVVGVKHFAFNDQEANRDGIAVFFEEQGGRENELRGFEYALNDAQARSVMTGFNRIGVTFCSADHGFIAGLVRSEWNYNGFVFTDSVKSGAYMRANECFAAGNDMMLGGLSHAGEGSSWPEIDEKAILKYPALVNSVREAYHRYLYQIGNSQCINGLDENSATGEMAVWEKGLFAAMGAAGIMTATTFIFWILAVIEGKKGAKSDE